MTDDRTPGGPPGTPSDVSAGSTTSDYSAFTIQATEIIRSSQPMTIGKHEWRLTQYRHREYGITSGYEWRRLNEIPGFPPDFWRRDTDWPRYDCYDGQDRGLPKTLRKLWEQCPWAHRRRERQSE